MMYNLISKFLFLLFINTKIYPLGVIAFVIGTTMALLDYFFPQRFTTILEYETPTRYINNLDFLKAKYFCFKDV